MNSEAWYKILRRDYPCIPHNNKEANFEKDLIGMIKQLEINKVKDNILVGLVGYPNTGKATLIDEVSKHRNPYQSIEIPYIQEVIVIKKVALTNKYKVFKTAGTIFSKNDNFNVIPKAFKEISECPKPIEIVTRITEKVPELTILEFYEVAMFNNVTEFLISLCKKFTYFIKVFLLKKGGHPDVERAALRVVEDILTGKLKFESNNES